MRLSVGLQHLMGRAIGALLIGLIAAPLPIMLTGEAVAQSATPSKPKIPPYNAKFWREKKGAITNADRERMAKFTAYRGGVPQPGVKMSDTQKAQLTIANDKAFRQHLKTNRLKYVDSIDNDTGLQATLVQDLDTKRFFILVRGSEFDREPKKDGMKADTAGAGSGALTIGKKQYDSGKKKFADWINSHNNNIEVIGHSLGGAIVQRIVLDNVENIVSATVLNSPGVEVSTVESKISRPSDVKKFMNPDGTYKLHIFNAVPDAVGYAGGVPVPAEVVLAHGGALENGLKAAHTQLIFGPDVVRDPVDYSSYALDRDRSDGVTGYVGKDLGRRLNNLIWFKDVNANPLFDFVMRTQDYQFKIQRKIHAAALKKMKKANKLRELARLTKAKIATTKLDLEDGRRKPIPKKPKKKAPPVASAPTPAKKSPPRTAPAPQTPPSGVVDGIYTGRYIGQRVTLADGAELRNGKLAIRIAGTTVDGKVGGQFVLYGNPNDFSAFIDGSYDPASGEISATVKGRWHGGNGGGLIVGKLVGKRTANGFEGKWVNENSSGIWSASPKN